MSLFILAALLILEHFRGGELFLFLDLKQQPPSTSLARLQQCQQRRGEEENKSVSGSFDSEAPGFIYLFRLLLHIIPKSSVL